MVVGELGLVFLVFCYLVSLLHERVLQTLWKIGNKDGGNHPFADDVVKKTRGP